MFDKSVYKAEILSREKFNMGFKIAEFYADFKSAGDVRKVIQSVTKKKVLEILRFSTSINVYRS